MKKVGILSMQRILNYGSFLQAYGLKSILEDLGCEVQFVDYHSGSCLIPIPYFERGGLKRKIAKVWEALSYDAPLIEKIRFIIYKKHYADKCNSLLGITETRNYTPAVDVLVIGSDEVFNCVQDNANVGYSPELFGEGNRAKKVISYAASFGNTTIEKLNKYNVADQVGGWLKAFAALSVRDANSGNIVLSLTGNEPMYHLDPVLMYDFKNKCDKIPDRVPESNYMILYGYSGRFSKDECQKIRAYADSNGLKVFCIGGVQGCCDRFLDCDPFEVLAYFRHAQCVVTDTFHGTILSVISHRPFVTYIRSGGYGNAEKLTDLLDRLGLSQRRVSDTAHVAEVMHQPIMYEAVDAVLAAERERTQAYLKQQITGEKEAGYGNEGECSENRERLHGMPCV